MINGFSFFVQRYFLSYLMNQHNYGPNTIASYRDTFKLLLTFLTKQHHDIMSLKVPDISTDIVTKFLEWIREERDNSVSSQNVRLAHIKSFFRYLMIYAPEYCDQCSQILGIPFAKVEKRPPKSLSEDTVKKLLSAVNPSTQDGIRHLAILTLLYDSGCRVQELINLNVSDFQSGDCSRIYVHGKGNKFRTIPLLKETEKIIKRYIKSYGLAGESALFFNANGGRLTRQGVRYIVRKYSSLANEGTPGCIDGNISPHRLRHSKATHLINGGVNIYNVRDFLGHESVTTTQVYLTSNPEVTRKAIEGIASKTIPESSSYYSDEQKADLMAFLETLK